MLLLLTFAASGCGSDADVAVQRREAQLDLEQAQLEVMARDLPGYREKRRLLLGKEAELVAARGLDCDALASRLEAQPPQGLSKAERDGELLRLHGDGGASDALSVLRAASALSPGLLLRELALRPHGWSLALAPVPAAAPRPDHPVPVPPPGLFARWTREDRDREELAKTEQRVLQLRKVTVGVADLMQVQERVENELDQAKQLQRLDHATEALAPLLREPAVRSFFASFQGDTLELREVRLAPQAAPDALPRLEPSLRVVHPPHQDSDGSYAMTVARGGPPKRPRFPLPLPGH